MDYDKERFESELNRHLDEIRSRLSYPDFLLLKILDSTGGGLQIVASTLRNEFPATWLTAHYIRRLEQAELLHVLKQQDYGGDTDWHSCQNYSASITELGRRVLKRNEEFEANRAQTTRWPAEDELPEDDGRRWRR